MANIDNLNIRINASATSANRAINDLVSSLSRLRRAVTPIANSAAVARDLGRIASAVDRFSGLRISPALTRNLNSLNRTLSRFTVPANALSGLRTLATALGNFSGVRLSTAIARNLTSLRTALNGFTVPANLVSSLNSIAGAVGAFSGLRIPANIATQLTALRNALTGFSIQVGVASGLTSIARALSAFAGVRVSTTIARELTALRTALSGFTVSANVAPELTTLAGALTAFGGVRISTTIARELTQLQLALAGFTLNPDTVTQLTTLATVLGGLNGVRISTNIARQLTELQRVMSTFTIPPAALTSLTSLATALTTLSTAAAGLRGAAGTIRSTITAASGAVRATGGALGGGLFGGLMRFGMLRMVTRYLGNMINLSNQYQEDMNLFTASLGKYAAEAKSYAEQVSEAFGLDPAEWIRNLGVFNTLISGYGVAADRAYKMSQNLTQLGYDLSSFFNIKSSDAMSKLQSAIAGELRPMRKLGYDLSQARLEYIAKTLGIEKEISNMNQAEKAQLRYYALLNQVTVAQGDMGRTIDTPASQLRILSAQVTQAGRAIGNVFIPMLNAILPVATAVMKAIRGIANAIANLFGFQLTEVDYSGLEDTNGIADELDESLTSAGGSAKKLKQALMGFDEINKLPDLNESGGGGGSGSGSDWEWDLSGYDFLGDAVNERLDAAYAKIKPFVDWATEHTSILLGIVEAIAATVIAIPGGLATLGTSLVGLASIAVGLVVSIKYGTDLQEEFLEDGDFSTFFAEWATKALGIVITSTGAAKLASAFGAEAGAAFSGTLPIAMLVTSAVSYNVALKDISHNGVNYKNITSALMSLLGIGVATATAGGPLLAGITIPLAVTFGIIKIYYDSTKVPNGVELTDEEIAALARSVYVNLEVEAQLDLIASPLKNLGTRRTQLKQALTLLSSDVSSFDEAFKTGVKVKIDTSAQTLYDDLTADDGILAELQGLIDEKKQFITAYASIGGFVDTDGNPIGMNVDLLSGFESRMNTIGTEWGKALQEGIKNGWSSELMDTISTLQYDFMRMQEAMTYSETAADAKYSMQQVWTELSKADLSSLAGFRDKVGGYKADTRQQLESDYDESLKNWYLESGYWSEYITIMERDLANTTDETEIAHITSQLTQAREQLGLVQAEIEKLEDPNNREASITNQLNTIYGGMDEKFWQIAMARLIQDEAFIGRAGKMSANSPEELQSVFESTVFGLMGDLGPELYKVMQEQNLTWEDLLGEGYLAGFAEVIGQYNDSSYASDALYDTLKANGLVMNDYVTEAINDLFFGSGNSYDSARYLVGSVLGASLEDNNSVKDVTNIPSEIYDALSTWINSSDLNSILSEMGITVDGMDAAEYFTRTQEELSATANALEEQTLTYSEATASISTAATSVDNAAAKIEAAAQRIQDGKIKGSFKIGITVYNPNAKGGGTGGVDSARFIQEYGTGGLPKMGSMFIAGERGPELVGKIGNRTAVANDEQISDIISSQMGGNEESLATAIVGAMKAAGMGAVYLDGRQLANSINSETRRTGKSAIVI